MTESFKHFIENFQSIEPLSNFDIIDICKKLKIQNFKGVYMRNEILGKASKNECLILNTDHSSNGGTHWTCLFVRGNTCFYFDSYGFPPPLEVEKYCHDVKNGHYSSFKIQELNGNPTELGTSSLAEKLDRVGCGHYCVYVLYKLYSASNFYDILDELFRYKK